MFPDGPRPRWCQPGDPRPGHGPAQHRHGLHQVNNNNDNNDNNNSKNAQYCDGLHQVDVCRGPEDDAEVHHHLAAGPLQASLQVCIF